MNATAAHGLEADRRTSLATPCRRGDAWLVTRIAVSAWTLWLVLCLSLVVLLGTAVGLRPYVISSGSMEPSISRGDVVLVGAHPEATVLAHPSVITFAKAGGTATTHRVVGVDRSTGRYLTRGDANASTDRSTVAPEDVHGVGRLLVPSLGLPKVWLDERAWRPLLLTALASVLAAVGVRPGRDETRSPPPSRADGGPHPPAGSPPSGPASEADDGRSSRDEPRRPVSPPTHVGVEGMSRTTDDVITRLFTARPPRRRRPLPRVALTAPAMLAVVAGTVAVSLATFAAAAAASASVVAMSAFGPPDSTAWYLRNSLAGGPTPTQALMPLTEVGTTTLPTGALPNQSADADTAPGRLLTTSGANAEAVWRTSWSREQTDLSGTSTVTIDVQRIGNSGGAATVTATISAISPAGTRTTIGTGSASTAAASPVTNPSQVLSITVPTAGTLEARGRIEVRLTVSDRDVRLRYDTTTFPARLDLPQPVSIAF
jgi:signal peptidase I